MQAKYILLFIVLAMAAVLVHEHTRAGADQQVPAAGPTASNANNAANPANQVDSTVPTLPLDTVPQSIQTP
jgi:hypothetical protein